MNRIRIKQAVVVEGKYDKIKLDAILDTEIVVTNGFGVFQDQERMRYIRRLAAERGILVLTDSDGAGQLIRSHLQGCIPGDQILHGYIPQLAGKEKRKDKPSKEGTLGVEGLDAGLLLEVVRRSGAAVLDGPEEPCGRPVTKADLFEDGLTGRPDSAKTRARLLAALELPSFLSVNALLRYLNQTYGYEGYKQLLRKRKEGTH